MSQQLSPQHPAVVLRSHFVQLRAVLAAALIAVICLTVAVVALATDDDKPAATVQALSAPAAPSTDTVTPPGIRYDGGPEEGTAGPRVVPNIRYDGGPEEGSVGLGH